MNDQNGKIWTPYFGKPVLISPAFMIVLFHAIETHMPEKMKISGVARAPSRATNPEGTGIIEVYDYLSYRADPLMSLFFGNTSYEDIRAQFQSALADPTVKNIVFDINSPGGECAGCFDLVDEIYQARGQKPIYAVLNEDALSAAYAIASAADKRYIARTGSAGSVGVVAMHIDQSGMDAQRGLVFTTIYAGARKADFSSHAPLSPGAMASAQEDVNDVYDIFVATIARNLNVTPAAVRATEAAIYQGKKAVKAGFADSVMSWNQFVNKLSNRKYGGIMKAGLENLWNEITTRSTVLTGSNSCTAENEVILKAGAEKLVAVAKERAKQEGFVAGLAEATQPGKEAGKIEAHMRVVQIMEICALAKMDAAALGYVRDITLNVEDVRRKVVESLADEARKTHIRSTVSALSTGEVPPVIQDARKRAEEANLQSMKRE